VYLTAPVLGAVAGVVVHQFVYSDAARAHPEKELSECKAADV
jgi:hypothetical protein